MCPTRTASCNLWPRLKGEQEGNGDSLGVGWEAGCLGMGASVGERGLVEGRANHKQGGEKSLRSESKQCPLVKEFRFS